MSESDSMSARAAIVGEVRDLVAETPYAGVTRRSIAGDACTVAVYEFAAGAEFPLHAHPQEQVTFVQSGQARFVAPDSDIDVTLTPGGWSLVAPDIPHKVIAGPQGTRFLAVIAPARSSDGYRVVAPPG